MSLDGCRWLSRSDSLPRPGHGLILVELTSLNAHLRVKVMSRTPRWRAARRFGPMRSQERRPAVGTGSIKNRIGAGLGGHRRVGRDRFAAPS